MRELGSTVVHKPRTNSETNTRHEKIDEEISELRFYKIPAKQSNSEKFLSRAETEKDSMKKQTNSELKQKYKKSYLLK